VIAVVLMLLTTGIAGAALLNYYGEITGTVVVAQSVLLDEGNYLEQVPYDSDLVAGSTDVSSHKLYNQAEVPATVNLVTSHSATDLGSNSMNSKGVTTTYLKEVGYSFVETVIVSDGTVGNLEVTVTEDGDWMVWTFDFPVEKFTGDGNLNVGLIIATDGEGNGPTFQIHNNDGTDAKYDWGTWLVSPYLDGWHSSDTNTRVTELDWVQATGNRNVPHGEGVMEIRIKKSELGTDFHWAASPTVGSGFYAPASDVTMQIPTAFGWSNEIVNMTQPNYVHAELMEEIVTPFTLQPDETLNFVIANHFDVALMPGTYTITTTVEPVMPTP